MTKTTSLSSIPIIQRFLSHSTTTPDQTLASKKRNRGRDKSPNGAEVSNALLDMREVSSSQFHLVVSGVVHHNNNSSNDEDETELANAQDRVVSDRRLCEYSKSQSFHLAAAEHSWHQLEESHFYREDYTARSSMSSEMTLAVDTDRDINTVDLTI